MSIEQIYRGMENGAETIDKNFSELVKMLADQKDATAITSISGGQGEVTNVSMDGTKFGFGSTIETTGTQPAFSVGADHFAVCQIAGVYLLDAQLHVQFNRELNGWVYLDLEVNGQSTGNLFAHGANTMRNKWYSGAQTRVALKVGDKLNFTSSCSDKSPDLATSLRCPLAKFQKIGD